MLATTVVQNCECKRAQQEACLRCVGSKITRSDSFARTAQKRTLHEAVTTVPFVLGCVLQSDDLGAPLFPILGPRVAAFCGGQHKVVAATDFDRAHGLLHEQCTREVVP